MKCEMRWIAYNRVVVRIKPRGALVFHDRPYNIDWKFENIPFTLAKYKYVNLVHVIILWCSIHNKFDMLLKSYAYFFVYVSIITVICLTM